MKFTKFLSLFLFPVLIQFLSGCNPSNRADFDKLFSPVNLPYLKPGKMMQVSSHDTTGGENDRITILPGKTVTIMNVSGPGVITRIWFRVDSPDPYYLRRILLRIYWDDEEKPSVESPLGDFFGNGFCYKPFTTPYLSMAGGGFSCFFPMPFEESARIEIVNETGGVIPGLFYQINYLKTDGYLGRDVGYFHACWNRSNRTDYDTDYTVLRIKGKGQIVGLILNAQSYNGSFSFLEGNERIFVDGEKKPSLFGTGMEDYFSSSGRLPQGEFSGPYNGLIFKDDSLGRIAAYRFHIYDPIPFRKSIVFQMEHGPGNRDLADISTTVFWYQLENHSQLPAMIPPGRRIPLRISAPSGLLEAENLAFASGEATTTVTDMQEYGTEWSSNAQLEVACKENGSFTLQLPAMKENKGTINLYFSKGPDYGNFTVFLDAQQVAGIHGYHPWKIPWECSKIPFDFPAGHRATLRFVSEGRDTRSTGYNAGIDGVEINPDRIFIPEWYVAGPFPLTGADAGEKNAMDSLFAPENSVDLNGIIPGTLGTNRRWILYTTPANGFADLKSPLSAGPNGVVYAVTYLYTILPRPLTLLIGTADSAKVIFNNRELMKCAGKRPAVPDQQEIPLNVKPGWNKLLLKIVSKKSPPGFYARIRETDEPVTVSANQVLSTVKK